MNSVELNEDYGVYCVPCLYDETLFLFRERVTFELSFQAFLADSNQNYVRPTNFPVN
jgi:hypothetical protein